MSVFVRKILPVFCGILLGIVFSFVCIYHFGDKPLIFVDNGENIKISKEDYMNLASMNEELNEEVLELQMELSSETDENEELRMTNKRYLNQIHGLNSEIKSYESNVTIDDEEVALSGSLLETLSFTDVCEAYDYPGNDSYTVGSIICQGIEYADCIYMNSLNDTYGVVMYNLQEQYSMLSFTLGRVDNSGMENCQINFYVDGNFISGIMQNAEDDITTRTIYLNKGKILEIKFFTGNTGYALMDAQIW